MMTKRQLRRIFRINQNDNLIIRLKDHAPVELLRVPCPVCGKEYYDCGHLNHLTFNQLVEQGYAKFVEQV